jgi:uncharacterized protein involved in exopolysaccharide biosynthesis
LLDDHVRGALQRLRQQVDALTGEIDRLKRRLETMSSDAGG